MKAEDVQPTDVVDVVVHGAFFPQLVAWVEARGCVMQPSPLGVADPNTPATFFIQPSPERMAAVRELEQEIHGLREQGVDEIGDH